MLEIKLGPLLGKYHGRPIRWRDLLMIFFPATLAVLMPLGYGLYRAGYGYAHFGPYAADAWSRSWFLLAAFATLNLLLLALYRIYIAHRFIAIHQNGIRVHLSPFKDTKVLWSQISGIATDATQDCFLGIPLRTKHQAIIYPTLGKPIRLDKSLGDVRALTREIENKVFPYLRPQINQAFRSGKWVYFGVLATHQEGLKVNQKFIPWDLISHLLVDSGHIVVKSANLKSISIPVSKINNLDLLFQLLEKYPLAVTASTKVKNKN